MSWKDKLDNNKFSIQMGDGKVFFPHWKDAVKSREFNSTAYDFIDVEGTFIDRRKPKSAKYDLQILFQGDDCWDQADSFEESAKDQRYWIINHPIYGTLKGQPISLSRNDSTINLVEISIEFWESNLSQYVEKRTTIKDDISDRKNQLDIDCANQFDLKAKIKPSNQNKVRAYIQNLNAEYKKFLDDSNYNNYQEVLSKCRDSIDGMIIDSRSMILDVNRTIDEIKNMPNVNVFQKITALSNLFNQLVETFSFNNITDFNRYYIESTGAAIISTMSLVGLNPNKNDYFSRNDVSKVSSAIDLTYVKYLDKLNFFEVNKNNRNNNFTSSFKIQLGLNLIVKKTLYELYSISFDFKQERVVELQNDSNLILLTHKYMGMDKFDENLERFRVINNIKNDSLFVVKKGSKIKYFI